MNQIVRDLFRTGVNSIGILLFTAWATFAHAANTQDPSTPPSSDAGPQAGSAQGQEAEGAPAGEIQERAVPLRGLSTDVMAPVAGAVASPAPFNSNTAVGTGALVSNTTGGNNTAMGGAALGANREGSNNTAMGTMALFLNTTGGNNTAVGSGALGRNLTSSDSTALGHHALAANTTGYANTAVGSLALGGNTTGTGNTATGTVALGVNTTGSSNTATGEGALRHNIAGSSNTATGEEALRSNTTGPANTATGAGALRANTTGRDNTATGVAALANNILGQDNTAMGVAALLNNTLGQDNTAIGFEAGIAQTTGSHNIYLNHRGVAAESGTIRIGTPLIQGIGQTRAFLAGVTGIAVSGTPVVVDANGQLGIQASSLRYKNDVQSMGDASRNLSKLRPVTFRYKPEIVGAAHTREFGLIAEEVAEVYPELVGHDAEGQIVTVQYHELIPMLLNELQQQHRQIEALTARVAEMEAK